MILSVVIVSYNVKFFLEQCLSSLKKAIDGSLLLNDKTQVYIIDNASEDGSVDFLKPRFPQFQFIQNSENRGFAKANNQVLSDCNGEFVLFLNPDTILAEDCLDICLQELKLNTQVGGVGVRMIDGSGNFLKESKRGIPGPLTSFFRISGLSRFFPKSSFFSAYYRGELSDAENHLVDILSGAFMMVRKTVLDQIGAFDERFFMYAEDIDLSWRIRQAGFLNFYLADASIIHFKGESTIKDINYIRNFHKAMELFQKKHFEKKSLPISGSLIRTGIWFREMLSRIRSRVKQPLKTSLRFPVYLKGDALSRKECLIKLEECKIPITRTEQNGKEFFYCEGPAFSWKNIIREISCSSGESRYFFHGFGTQTAISSPSGRSQGELFQL